MTKMMSFPLPQLLLRRPWSLAASAAAARQPPRRRLLLSTTTATTSRRLPKDGLTLADFVSSSSSSAEQPAATHSSSSSDTTSAPVKFHLKTYGCQMNVNDSDIVRSLLLEAGRYVEVSDESDADVLLTNTCAIRDHAEQRVWHRLRELRGKFSNNNNNKKKKKKQQEKKRIVVGVLGCMAERLKETLLEEGVADLVVGPDAYRDLPRVMEQLLLCSADTDVEQAVNVQLSLEETYADVTPVRRPPHSSNKQEQEENSNVSAFVSVMRGCNNMCSFCIVPFTRGRERSRPLDSIVREARHLHESSEGVKEIVLLGQNVNSYHDKSDAAVLAAAAQHDGQEIIKTYQTSNEGFTNLYKLRGGAGYYFADLVEAVSDISPELRVRFTSPHPKDYPPELLSLMAERPNVCNQLHMPAQSGSTSVLKRMRRGYTREAYLQLLEDVRSTIPDVAISTDIISGFCDETEEEHLETISLMEQVRYDQAFMFAYSMRDKTHAHRTMEDNVPEDVKQRRLQQVIETFRTQVQKRNEELEVGRLRLVLVEGPSKRSRSPDNISWHGRTDQNKRIVFPLKEDLSCGGLDGDHVRRLMLRSSGGGGGAFLGGGNHYDFSNTTNAAVPLKPGDYVVVQVTEARGHTLRGQVLWRTSLKEFSEMKLSLQDEALLASCLLSSSMTERESITA